MSLFELMADMFRPQETECLYECKMCHAYYPVLKNGYCEDCWKLNQNKNQDNDNSTKI